MPPQVHRMNRHPGSSRFQERAFTLVELLVVIVVIAILAAITLNIAGGVNQKATMDKARAEIAAISNALEQYKSVNDTYPPAGTSNTVPLDLIEPFYQATKYLTNGSGQLMDPYDNAYKYKVPGDNKPASFDLWTTDRNGNTLGNW